MNRKNHMAKIMAKQELPVSRRKRGSFAFTFTGSLSQPRESVGGSIEDIKTLRGPRQEQRLHDGKGFLDLAIKVKLRTKISMKSFINEKRTGGLWKHMNNNPQSNRSHCH